MSGPAQSRRPREKRYKKKIFRLESVVSVALSGLWGGTPPLPRAYRPGLLSCARFAGFARKFLFLISI